MRGEEERLWAKICAAFDDLSEQADNDGLEKRFRELRSRTLQQDASPWEWKELLDELAMSRTEIDDYAGRDGDHALARLPEHYQAPRPDFVFVCPTNLCVRRAAGSALGPKPRCELFDHDMIEEP